MKDIIRTFIVLCTIANVLCLTCLQNYSQVTVYNFTASDTVGQFIDSSSLTENTFAGASLKRADITPITGTFFIIPGQDSNTSNALWSASFSSSSDTIYANGTVTLPPSSFTFLWVRDGTGEPTSVFLAGDWLLNSAGFAASSFGAVDVAGQFCFSTPASPSATPSASSAPTPSVSATPSPSATPSASPAVLPPNHPPAHIIRGFNASEPNVTMNNAVQIVFRNSQGTSGQKLQITINDPDCTADQLIKFSASISMIASTGNNPATLDVPFSDTLFVNMIVNNGSYIELTGTLANVNSAIARMAVKWSATDNNTFRVFVTVDDLGNTGGCNGVPCSLWTMSRTDFRTTLTGV